MYIGSLKNTNVLFNKLWFIYIDIVGNTLNNGIKINAYRQCVEFNVYKKQKELE